MSDCIVMASGVWNIIMSCRFFSRMSIALATVSLCTIFSAQTVFGTTDRVAPSFSWISPEDFTVLTTNTVRVAVRADDGPDGSGIRVVRFYANYMDDSGIMSPRELIGETQNPPYEILWNCASIPDYSLGRLRFSCEVTDNTGNVSITPESDSQRTSPLIVLDRNQEKSNAFLNVHFTKKQLVIDGILDEWAGCDSTSFFNNDNSMFVYALWNREKLFIAIRATGRSIVSTFPEGSNNVDGMALEDVMEIFIDANHDRSGIFAYPDRHFLVSPAGMIYEDRVLLDDGYQVMTIIDPPVESGVMINGTVNDDSDVDVGYTVEFAITWEELDVDAETGVTMGLEIWNNDKDFVGGQHFATGWSTTITNMENPSEWGTIRLDGGERHVADALIALVAFGLMGTVSWLILERQKSKKSADSDSHESVPVVDEKDFIRKARDYVDEHYSDETLSRETVAPYVGLTASYFGKQFKHETGVCFSEYITEKRLERARELLFGTQKTVSEIALDVGFNSQSYFTVQFKKHTGMSPTEYRSNSRSKTGFAQ